MTETTPSPLGNVITIDDERIKNHLDCVVRGSVEETLNALLESTMQCATLPGRPLRAQAADEGRRGQAADTEASDADIRNGHH